MLVQHKNLIQHGALAQDRRRVLIGRPFVVRDKFGMPTLQGRAYGFMEQLPQVEIDGRRYKGMTWIEVAAAVERGAVPDINRLEKM